MVLYTWQFVTAYTLKEDTVSASKLDMQCNVEYNSSMSNPSTQL